MRQPSQFYFAAGVIWKLAMRIFDPPDRTLIHHRLAPIKSWYSFTDLVMMEVWVSFVQNDGHKVFQISATTWTSCWKVNYLVQLRQLHLITVTSLILMFMFLLMHYQKSLVKCLSKNFLKRAGKRKEFSLYTFFKMHTRERKI